MRLTVTARYCTESALLILLSAVLYWLGFELQARLFAFTEHIGGVNWFYLPSGLRVMLVLVAGIFGALGISIATLVIDLLHIPDIRGAALLWTAVSSGFGAWVALWFLRWRGTLGPDLLGLRAAVLLQLGLVYAVLNALFHQVAWWVGNRQASIFWVDLWPMFVGDLLGALVFLYGFRALMRWRRPTAS